MSKQVIIIFREVNNILKYLSDTKCEDEELITLIESLHDSVMDLIEDMLE